MQTQIWKLAFAKAPAGTPDIPLNIIGAKEIKKLISEKEVISFVAGNDSDIEDDENANMCAANLSDDIGNVKCPASKKHKPVQVADKIQKLGGAQVEAASELKCAINNVATALMNSLSSNNQIVLME